MSVYCNHNNNSVLFFIFLATEAHDNDGIPHTLEHLIFLGSEGYPFKGVLDLLANRCLASGTNAWTGNDLIFSIIYLYCSIYRLIF